MEEKRKSIGDIEYEVESLETRVDALEKMHSQWTENLCEHAEANLALAKGFNQESEHIAEQIRYLKLAVIILTGGVIAFGAILAMG